MTIAYRTLAGLVVVFLSALAALGVYTELRPAPDQS